LVDAQLRVDPHIDSRHSEGLGLIDEELHRCTQPVEATDIQIGPANPRCFQRLFGPAIRN
jgi:hypothetical protein